MFVEDRIMLGNYLKLSLRNLLKYKLYSIINVLGLAVGFTCFILIALFVRDELGFDRFHPGFERSYRLSIDFTDGPTTATNAFFAIPLFRENLPEIELAGRLIAQNTPVQRRSELFNEAGFRLVDPEIFELFSFTWLQGDPASALSAPHTLVLTESIALKYFGSEDPVGQTLLVNRDYPMTVTGVIRDLPGNTHLEADLFTSIDSGIAMYGAETMARPFDSHSYVRLQPGVAIGDVSERFTDLLNDRMQPFFQNRFTVTAKNISAIHFNSAEQKELSAVPGSLGLVLTFGVIAVGILCIASINFMNLSTARSSLRAKEVGMRKSISAARGQLVAQFLGESALLSLLAMVCALVLVELLLPAFSTFVGKNLAYPLTDNPLQAIGLLVLGLVVGLAAGSYPALFLSAFEPARVMQGHVDRGRAGLLFRNVLVVLQFSISISLIVAAAVIYAQLDYARNLELGYDKEQVVILNGSSTEKLGAQWPALKQQLLSNPGVLQVSASMMVPGVLNDWVNTIWPEGSEAGVDMAFVGVDFDYFDTYDIGLVAGRTFDENLDTDRLRFPSAGNPTGGGVAYVLNARAARELGWSPDEALGKTLAWSAENGVSGPVIGVVEDVYYESVRNAQKPLLYLVTSHQFGALSWNYAALRLSGEESEATLRFIDDTWTAFMPGQPVSRSFLDQNLDAMYQAEDQQGQLFSYFSMLAILIACFGLYGLASFNVERRTKEIGVRKVMGGSVWSIVLLLTNDFSRLVLLANLIAWPIAYFAMERWLENFAYRIDLTPLVFIGSGLIALCIAWVTVGGTAAKAASAKPVLALRYE
jgi:putative ABC transport system permease protein